MHSKVLRALDLPKSASKVVFWLTRGEKLNRKKNLLNRRKKEIEPFLPENVFRHYSAKKGSHEKPKPTANA